MKKTTNSDSFIIDGHCFVCGEHNLSGLKLKIASKDSKAICKFKLSKKFQGYGGIIHGGILGTILDELMIYALFFQNIPTVTAKMEVVFKRKAYAGEPLVGEGWLMTNRGKIATAESHILNTSKEIVAKGSGLFATINEVVIEKGGVKSDE